MTGTLPQSWGGNGAFAALQDLQLSSSGIQSNMVFCVVSGCVQVLMLLVTQHVYALEMCYTLCCVTYLALFAHMSNKHQARSL